MADSDIRLAKMWPHPPDAQATIHRKHERLWVVHQDLIDAGYSHLADFSIVLVNGTFYELQAHTTASYRILGEHYPAGLWWIEETEDAPEAP